MNVSRNTRLYTIALPRGGTAFLISNQLKPDKYQAVQDIIDKTNFDSNDIDDYLMRVNNAIWSGLKIEINFLPVTYVFRKRGKNDAE